MTLAAGHQRDPPLLPHERDADLVRLGDAVQPPRDRPLGAELRVPQLLRLVRRQASERLRAEAGGPADLRLDRGDLQLPARAQGGHRPRQGARPRQGRLPDVRRGDRAARGGGGARGRVPAGRPAEAARLEDRDDAARRRGRGAERPQHARTRGHLRRPARARCGRRDRHRPGRPDALRRLRPDDLLHRLRAPTGTSTRRRWPARS